MFFIRLGTAEVLTELGTQPVAVLGPGKFFGEEALLTAAPRNAHVVAAGNVLLYVLEKSDLESVFQDFPGLEELLSESGESRRTHIQQLNAKTSPKKTSPRSPKPVAGKGRQRRASVVELYGMTANVASLEPAATQALEVAKSPAEGDAEAVSPRSPVSETVVEEEDGD